ncbi:hypothetical protein COLO4_19682 [Corchorus olitorius]|uniref:Uncharacterized protein n=1 Tax=Corchorus olitorius TaxID=93759 RepID=A0A1R3J429_9ROSI|nr:hypothetical protein COLO4_19682 [Corchorus olitorius]
MTENLVRLSLARRRAKDELPPPTTKSPAGGPYKSQTAPASPGKAISGLIN